MITVLVQHDVGDAAGVVDVSVQANLLTRPIAVNLDEILRQETAFTIRLSDDARHPFLFINLTEIQEPVLVLDATDRIQFSVKRRIRQIVLFGHVIEVFDRERAFSLESDAYRVRHLFHPRVEHYLTPLAL